MNKHKLRNNHQQNGGREIEHDLFAGIPEAVEINPLFRKEIMASVLATPIAAGNGAAFYRGMH